MKIAILIIIFFTISFVTQAESVQLSKEEILQSLEMLKKEGKISEADYIKSKKELMKMTDIELQAMNKKAAGIVKNNPGQAENMYKDLNKSNQADLESLQKELDKSSK